MDPLQQRVLIEQVIPGLPKLGPAVEWQIVGIFTTSGMGISRRLSRGGRALRPVAIPGRDHWRSYCQDPAAMIKTIAAVVHSVDPQIALARTRTFGPGEG